MTQPYLKQDYTLKMNYDDQHNILNKNQLHRQGTVDNLGSSMQDTEDTETRHKTSYELEYKDYGTGSEVVAGYGYNQPHSPRKIVETPTGPDCCNGTEDPRIKEKSLDYDYNGNRTAVREQVGQKQNTLQKLLRYEENRLMAVDLDPDNDDLHPVAAYTYEAGGERIVKYNVDRLDVSSNANDVSKGQHDNIAIYPSGLLTARPKDKKFRGTPINTVSYTKHYYAGGQRVQSKIGTTSLLGMWQGTWFNNEFPELDRQLLLDNIEDKLTSADSHLVNLYNDFFELTPPTLDSQTQPFKGQHFPHDPDLYAAFWFHPDHLGSSNYITNLAGNVSQHMEYLPFGETLVEEHLNSNNSPYKFNGKELDEETGNYYYGARYYDPKFSMWLSVDPMAEKYPSYSPYAYTLNNPINLTDPTGMSAENAQSPTDWYWNLKTDDYEWFNGSEEREGYERNEITVSNVLSGGKNFQLQEGGRFVDLDSGEGYGKGDEVSLNGISIKSHGNWFEESQTWVRHNKGSLLDASQKLQDSGDLVTGIGLGAAGVGSFVAGIGAAPGLVIAGIGNGVGLSGSFLELGTELMSTDWNNASETGGFILGGIGINLLVDRAIPGPTPNISRESTDILKMSLKTVPARTAERAYRTSNDN